MDNNIKYAVLDAGTDIERFFALNCPPKSFPTDVWRWDGPDKGWTKLDRAGETHIIDKWWQDPSMEETTNPPAELDI